MNKSVINSYRAQSAPAQQQTPPVIAGRIVPIATRPDPRPALLMLAALVLPALLVGVVVYAAQNVQVTSAPTPSPVVEVTAAAPLVIVVTATPASEVQAAPQVQVAPTPQPQAVQVAPVAPRVQVQARPQAAPAQVQPTARKVQAPQAAPPAAPQATRPAASQPAPTAVPGPQERLLSRGCEYRRTTYPQGTIIQGYYTDANGKARPAVCRVDGWKAAD